MFTFFLKRFFSGVPLILGIATLVFLLFNVMPGDPVQMMLGQRTDPKTVAMVRSDLGLDLPFLKRYLVYMNDLSPVAIHNVEESSSAIHLDPEKYPDHLQLFEVGNYAMVLRPPYLRRSYQSQRTVNDVIAEALPGTAVLALVSMALATVIGVVFGIFGALYRGGLVDRSLMVLSILGMSLPSFVAAIIAVWIFAYLLGDLTGLPVTGSLFEVDEFEGRRLVLGNLILPVLTIAVRPLAVIMQLTRNSMLEVLSMDYVRTAVAKGLPFRNVVVKHALRNAMGPVITAVSSWLASLLAGAVFVEIVFGWKGMGLVILNALNTYDLPVVMGSILAVSVIFVAIDLLVDMLYGIFDPRVSIK